MFQVAPGRHKEGVFLNANGVIDPKIEAEMSFVHVVNIMINSP